MCTEMREKLLQEDELRRNRLWKAMRPYEKHMVLMYLHKLFTIGPDRAANTLEGFVTLTRLKICTSDLPDFVGRLQSKPARFRELAYEAINEPMPEKEGIL